MSEDSGPQTDPPIPPDYKSWLSHQQPEIRDNPALSSFESFEDLGKEHINVQALIGRKGFIPPKDDDIHDTARFLTELGRPDASTGYTPLDAEQTELAGWSPELHSNINTALFDSGLTDTQYQSVLPKVLNAFKAEQEAIYDSNEADAEAKLNHLKGEFGVAYDSKMKAGERALVGVFGHEGAKGLLEMQMADGVMLANHEVFVRGLIKMGEDHYIDDGLVDSRGVRVEGVMTPDSAKREIDSLYGDESFTKPYYNKSHPGHKEANRRMESLFKMAYPAGSP